MRSIVLIGMSNAGKSHWSKRLAEFMAEDGFTRVCCDDEIEKKLEPFLKKKGYSGIEDVAKWMGQPYEKRYKANSAMYLKYEKRVMWSIIRRMLRGERLIVDTTGSVIYTGWLILWLLQRLGNMVFLDVTVGLQDEMLRKYISNPKPVIWGKGIYRPGLHEAPSVTLGRCYKRLLESRTKTYQRIARRTIGYYERRSADYTVQDMYWRVTS